MKSAVSPHKLLFFFSKSVPIPAVKVIVGYGSYCNSVIALVSIALQCFFFFNKVHAEYCFFFFSHSA